MEATVLFLLLLRAALKLGGKNLGNLLSGGGVSGAGGFWFVLGEWSPRRPSGFPSIHAWDRKTLWPPSAACSELCAASDARFLPGSWPRQPWVGEDTPGLSLSFTFVLGKVKHKGQLPGSSFSLCFFLTEDRNQYLNINPSLHPLQEKPTGFTDDIPKHPGNWRRACFYFAHRCWPQRPTLTRADLHREPHTCR